MPSKQIAQVSSLETWIFRGILEVDRKKQAHGIDSRRCSDISCLMKWILLCLLSQRSQTKWDVVSTRVQLYSYTIVDSFWPMTWVSTYLWLKKNTSKNPAPFQRWTDPSPDQPPQKWWQLLLQHSMTWICDSKRCLEKSSPKRWVFKGWYTIKSAPKQQIQA